MIVVGISAYYHDSAVALVRGGVIVNAAQEEASAARNTMPAGSVQSLSHIGLG
jgi:carbamoyltransferase